MAALQSVIWPLAVELLLFTESVGSSTIANDMASYSYNVAVVSYTSSIPQDDIGDDHLGL